MCQCILDNCADDEDKSEGATDMMSDNIVIRTMRRDDVQSVFELGHDCFDQNRPINRFWTIDVPQLAVVTDPDHCFVAVDNDRIVGFSIGAGQFGSDSSLGFIRWTAVHSEYRSGGLGRRLFAANVRSMITKQKAWIITDIETSNTASEKMVQRLGFRVDFTMNYWSVSATDFLDG